MKILFACIPIPNNRFLTDLKDGLEEHAEVVWDSDEFWKMENAYDIIHIHWPEYLSYEIESYMYKSSNLPKSLWSDLMTCLEYWSKESKIFYTRHVQYPHARHDEEFLKLYQIVSSYCHTVVHFANFSIEQFKAYYPNHKGIVHSVVPHHNYSSLPDTVTKEQARSYLGIDSESRVMLVFGGVKDNERDLIKKAFSYIPDKNKVLLAPGWKVKRRNFSYIRLREWVYKLECKLAERNKYFRINKGFIHEDEAQYYLNAADFLLIPRTKELNSGNITLGCTFGLVVVGKNTEDIGEILEETGNPTFQVGNNSSLRLSIEKAIELSDHGHGITNKEVAYEKWSVSKIAKDYIDLMNLAVKSN